MLRTLVNGDWRCPTIDTDAIKIANPAKNMSALMNCDAGLGSCHVVTSFGECTFENNGCYMPIPLNAQLPALIDLGDNGVYRLVFLDPATGFWNGIEIAKDSRLSVPQVLNVRDSQLFECRLSTASSFSLTRPDHDSCTQIVLHQPERDPVVLEFVPR